MANIEVAYQIRNGVRFMVASEELVPGHSWPYDTILGELRAHPEMRGADFARWVVSNYTAYYAAHPPAAGDVTKAALDLAQVDALAGSVDLLAVALIAGMEHQADALWKAQSAAFQHETRKKARTPNKFDYHLWDIGSLAAALLAENAASAEVKNAAGQVVHSLQPGTGAVLAEGHRGEWFDGIGGVTIYLMPSGEQQISPFTVRQPWQRIPAGLTFPKPIMPITREGHDGELQGGSDAISGHDLEVSGRQWLKTGQDAGKFNVRVPVAGRE
jgi:hypothetical protein